MSGRFRSRSTKMEAVPCGSPVSAPPVGHSQIQKRGIRVSVTSWVGWFVAPRRQPTRLPVIVNPESTQLSEYYDARLGEVLELAVSIGSVLMASGMSASDTVIQVKAIAAAYGIENCDVDVTNTVIFIAVYRGPTLPPASTLHTVRSRSMDFSRLAAVDRLIHRIRTEPLPPATARAELDRIVTAPHPYKRWVATLAWGGLAFSLAGTLGGDLLVCLVSALSTMLIDRVNRRLNRHGLPFFFQHAVGGAIATAPPLALYLLGPKFGLQFDPTIAIAAGLVVLLAGLSLVGSVQDVITGAPVTAVARFFELVMLTAATIAGVAFVLHVADPVRRARPHDQPERAASVGRADCPGRVRCGEFGCLRPRLLHRAKGTGGRGDRWRSGRCRVPLRAGVGSERRRRLVRRRRAGRAGRAADGTTPPDPSVDGVDIGYHPVAAGSIPTSRCIRNPQRRAHRRVCLSPWGSGNQHRPRRRRHTRRMGIGEDPEA